MILSRVGPFSLINDLNADFFIIKEENTEECQIYNHFLKGFGGNYKLLKTKPLNKIPGNEFFEPGTNKPNGDLSVNVEDISWSNYDIVISINFSVPSNIVKLHKNTLRYYHLEMYKEIKQYYYHLSIHYQLHLDLMQCHIHI